MIDLHTHTLFSDGVLIPSEHIRRFEVLNYSAVAITDHSDSSNLDFIVPRLVKVADELNRLQTVNVVPGVEITHAPPKLISSLIKKARGLGAKIVVIHGETVVEPVPPGTNRAGIVAGADIIAHPGLISIEDVTLAKENGVLLEITARSGHSLTNGHVAKIACELGAGLILNSDAHTPKDFMTKDLAHNVIKGAGVPTETIPTLFTNARLLLEKIGYSI